MANRSARRRLAACLGLSGLAAIGAQDLLARCEDWQAERALRALPGVRVAAVSHDAGGRLVLRDLDVLRDGVRVAVGRLSLARPPAGFALIGPAAAGTADALAGAARAAGTGLSIAPPKPAIAPAPVPDAPVAVADDLRILANGRLYRVPHLELRGTRLGPADLAGLFDDAQPGTLADRLSHVSATVVRASELVIASDPAAPDAAEPVVTLHGLVLTGIVAGRVGSLAVDRVTSAGQAGAGTFATGAIRADAVDLPLAATLLGGARSDAGIAPQLVFANATLAGVTAGNGGGDALTLGALRIGALRARPLPRTVDAIGPLVSRPVASLSPEERGTLLGGIADLAESYAVDHVELDDLRFQDGATPTISFGVTRAALDGIGGGRDLSLNLDAVALDTPDASLKLDRAVLWGLDQGSLVGLARRSGGGAGDASQRQIRTGMAATGLALAVPSKDHSGNDADGALIRMVLPEAGAAVEGSPTGLLTSTAHLHLAAPLPDHYADPQLAGLVALGLSQIDVAADYDAAYDRAARRLSLGRFALDAAGLGSVTFGAVLDNVDADPTGLAPESGARAPAAETVALAGASFRFVNTGIVEKALPLLAASADVSLPVFKASLKAQAAVAIAQAFGDAPAAAKLNAAVTAFVDDPRSFSLAVTVPGGRTLAALQATAPAALARIVTVTAAANR